MKVYDSLFPITGVVVEILKTRIKVSYNGEIISYDFQHAKQFLHESLK